ncbi:MAG: hypothetical protein WBB45_16205 [Cyclobacteriaceae bacterium]
MTFHNLTISKNDGYIDDLMVLPQGNQGQGISMAPGIGMTASAMIDGTSQRYTYDPLGRLLVVKNQFDEVVQVHEYDYYEDLAFDGYLQANPDPPVQGSAVDLTLVTSQSLASVEWKVLSGGQETILSSTGLTATYTPGCSPFTVRVTGTDEQGIFIVRQRSFTPASNFSASVSGPSTASATGSYTYTLNYSGNCGQPGISWVLSYPGGTADDVNLGSGSSVTVVDPCASFRLTARLDINGQNIQNPEKEVTVSGSSLAVSISGPLTQTYDQPLTYQADIDAFDCEGAYTYRWEADYGDGIRHLESESETLPFTGICQSFTLYLDVSDSYGNTVSTSEYITAPAIPSVSITSNIAQKCKGEFVTYDADYTTGCGANTYQWFEWKPVSGSIASSWVPIVDAVGPILYAKNMGKLLFVVTDESGRTGQQLYDSVYSCTTSQEDPCPANSTAPCYDGGSEGAQ